MLYLAAFFFGAALSSLFENRVIKPWARRSLKRPLECDLWGLEDK